MSFVPHFSNDIFVSYAHVDDVPSTGAPLGWIEALVQELRTQLAQKLGRADTLKIWKDHEQLQGHRELTPAIVESLRNSAVILPILSRGYLSSEWCRRELATFDQLDAETREQRSRIFCVERDSIPRIERPLELEELMGYQFWKADEDAIVRPLSLIPPVFHPDAYHQVFGRLVSHLGDQLCRMKKAGEQPVAARRKATPEVRSAQGRPVEPAPLRIEPLEATMRRPEQSDGIFVGIADFHERSFLPRLRFAVDDAVALAHLFVLDLKLIAPQRAKVALSGEPNAPEWKTGLQNLRAAGVTVLPATRTELLLALQALAEARTEAEGLLLTSISTHGYEENGDVYLMPADGIRRFTSTTGLPFSLLRSTLRDTPAATKLLIVDACRSPVEGGSKGAEAMTLGFEHALKNVEDFQVLCSCGAGQSSWEAPDFGLGIFTHYLREGMLGGATARSTDGVLSLDSIFAFAMSNTNQFVRKNINVEQLPWCGNEKAIRDLPFAISRDALARAAEVIREQQNVGARKEEALRLLFDVRRRHRGVIAAQMEHIERELDFLTDEPLAELLENLEKLSDGKLSSCKLFHAWWEESHAAAISYEPSRPDLGRPWMNSLGMNFVPVGGVLFAVNPTRVQDFKAFARESGYKPAKDHFFSLQNGTWTEGEFSWTDPGFKQGLTHPVVGMTAADAEAFCTWLTEHERRAGLLGAQDRYALPADATWSLAVGETRFPWGDDFPPPPHAGNYAPQPGGEQRRPLATTSVGTFPPNRLGLCDLGGNVWEWCEDFYRREMNAEALRAEFAFLDDDGGGAAYRFLRGGSWFNSLPRDLLAQYRNPGKYPESRFANVGFRVVLKAGSTAREHDFHV